MRTYVDSGVLITAARGVRSLSEPALSILADPAREFVSSEWVRLEVLPKALYFQRESEARFYDLFFARVSVWALFEADLLARAMDEAVRSGLSAVDSIHVVLAAATGCEELVTSEKSGAPIHRTSRVKVVSLQSAGPTLGSGGAEG